MCHRAVRERRAVAEGGAGCASVLVGVVSLWRVVTFGLFFPACGLLWGCVGLHFVKLMHTYNHMHMIMHAWSLFISRIGNSH